MTREYVYSTCLTGLDKSNFLLLELPTGYGKSKLSINIINHLVDTKYKNKHTSMLLLVAKTVHKQTWKEEFTKWGGINVDSITIECYESLKKHEYQHFDFIIADEVHHINSDLRLDSFSKVTFSYFIGLSATIPIKLKGYLNYKYKAHIVSCKTTDAIKDNVLPEPKIILLPLQLDNTRIKETIEVNPKVKGITYHGTFDELWKYRKMRVHALISCTERQKIDDLNAQILREKNQYAITRRDFFRNRWLFDCGERLKYLANLKNDIIYKILQKLSNSRTITFCKTINQAECLGKYCIHSKNKQSDIIYKAFNDKKINHITSVNILNENANLVDCKYAIFANYSSSDICSTQRIGRSLRHKSPVIILPYYMNTREEEVLQDMIKDFNKNAIHTIHSLSELDRYIED